MTSRFKKQLLFAFLFEAEIHILEIIAGKLCGYLFFSKICIVSYIICLTNCCCVV